MTGSTADTMETGSDDIEEGVENISGDEWGWGGPLVPVPGFGFLPQRVSEKLEQIAEVGIALSQIKIIERIS